MPRNCDPTFDDIYVFVNEIACAYANKIQFLFMDMFVYMYVDVSRMLYISLLLLFYYWFFLKILLARYGIPDSKVHGANMGPNWVLSATDPRNLAIRDNKDEHRSASRTICTSDWIHCIAWITLPNLHVILHHGNHTASYILECSISRPATRWFLFQVGQSCCCQCSEDIVIDRGKIWD